ncbi:MAG: hypothetical protein P1V36_05370 [Planctomycetota bacterium]|nr:hypothetical protein [Planctomycetota bacterium]
MTTTSSRGRLMGLLRILLPAAALLCLGGCGDETRAPGPRWIHTAVALEDVPRDRPVHVWMDGDALRSAYIEEAADGLALVVGGKPGKRYAAMPVTWGMPGTDVSIDAGGPAVFFGPHGRRIAHTAQTRTGVAYVIDGVEGPSYARIWPLTFGADGARHAYAASRDDATYVVVDGQEIGPVHELQSDTWDGWPTIRFSGDGTRVAFVERRVAATGGARQRAWIDNVPQPWFDDVRYLVLAPAGDDYAYVARGGAVGPAFKEIGRLAFSPDGKHLAYYGRRQDASGLILDNVPQTEGMTDIVGPVVFSPDGKAIAYTESVEGGWRVVAGGVAGATYERVSGLAFAPGGHAPVYIAQTGATMFPVIGAAAGPPAANTWFPQFSRDGAHHAYRQRTGATTTMVVDGQARAIGSTWAHDPLLSPSGQSVAYATHGGDAGARLVIDGEAGPAFDAIHLAAGGLRLQPASTRPGVFPVCGHATSHLGALHAHAVFSDEDTVRYLARRDGVTYRVEAKRQ